MRYAAWLYATLAATAITFPALSHDHATGVVKERMDMMEGIAKRMKTIRQRIVTKRDLSTIKGEAEVIASSAPHMAHLFPPGSDQKPTDARPAIWREWADFERQAKALEAESKKLAGTTPNDPDAIDAQYRALLLACSGCHEKYCVPGSRKRDF